MNKYQLTINQRIQNDSADEWIETFDTYEKARERMLELKKKNSIYDPNYSIVVVYGIETIEETKPQSVHYETAYGSTQTLSFAINVF
jgi:hypothetical protein